jgi:preprotein translocase subunit SecG
MENVVLTVHLIIALMMIGVVLLQRSEGGGLLSGGGAFSARGAANALTKLTWILAAAFIITSITLTILAAEKSKGTSVLDALTGAPEAPADTATTPAAPAAPAGDLLPPPATDAPAAPPPAN